MRGQHADCQRCCFVQSRPHLCCRCVPIFNGLGYTCPRGPVRETLRLRQRLAKHAPRTSECVHKWIRLFVREGARARAPPPHTHPHKHTCTCAYRVVDTQHQRITNRRHRSLLDQQHTRLLTQPCDPQNPQGQMHRPAERHHLTLVIFLRFPPLRLRPSPFLHRCPLLVAVRTHLSGRQNDSLATVPQGLRTQSARVSRRHKAFRPVSSNKGGNAIYSRAARQGTTFCQRCTRPEDSDRSGRRLRTRRSLTCFPAHTVTQGGRDKHRSGCGHQVRVHLDGTPTGAHIHQCGQHFCCKMLAIQADLPAKKRSRAGGNSLASKTGSDKTFEHKVSPRLSGTSNTTS